MSQPKIESRVTVTQSAGLFSFREIMQRRSAAAVLPVTKADEKATRPKKRRGKRKSSPSLTRLVILATAFGVMVVGVRRFLFGSSSTSVASTDRTLQETNGPPLSQFPSIQWALDNSEIVGLFFAADWCPQSTPVTNLLDAVFVSSLFEPRDDDKPLKEKHVLTIIYVSSDRNEDHMHKYRRSHWHWVKYHGEERANIKRHFKTCAKREMKGLGMERREHEIPTLIVISGRTRQVLTYDGVTDVQEKGIEALDKWLALIAGDEEGTEENGEEEEEEDEDEEETKEQ